MRSVAPLLRLASAVIALPAHPAPRAVPALDEGEAFRAEAARCGWATCVNLGCPESWDDEDRAALAQAQVERWEVIYSDPRSYDEISDEDALAYADEVEERRHEGFLSMWMGC